MRTLFDKRRLGHASLLLAIALGFFGLAWATWPQSTEASCTGPDVSHTEIRRCVAESAQDTEPKAQTLAALVVGTAALGASVVIGGSAVRRVMTLARAADELGISPGGVRQLMDQGIFAIHDRRQGALYLSPERVRQVASRGQTQDLSRTAP